MTFCQQLQLPFEKDIEELLQDQPLIVQVLKNECRVDHQDGQGRTAIFLLYDNFNAQVCKRLYDHKPNVNIPNIEGTYPIHVASRRCTEDVVEELIKYGANTKVWDRFKRSPLHNAVNYNTTEVIDVLVKNGCSKDDVDVEGNGLFHFAAMRCDPKASVILKFVIDLKVDLITPNIYGKTALHYTIMKLDCLKVILSNSKNIIDKVDKQGKTALHYASCYFHSIRQVKVLLKEGSNPNIRDNLGCNCLMYACKEGAVQTMDALLPHFVKTINESDKFGNTALHYASMRADISHHVKHLLGAGADSNIQNCQGKTPLMLAFETQRSETIDLLRDRLSDNTCNFRDVFGRSALHYAILYSSKYKVEDEQGTSATIAGKPLLSTENHVRDLLEKGADVDMVDVRRMAPLHYASGSSNGNLEIVVLLLRAGADVYVRECNGKLPIHVAVENEAVDVVRCLMDATKLTEEDVSQLFHSAAKTSNLELLMCLLELQIRLDLPNQSGESIVTAARLSTIGYFHFLCTKSVIDPNLQHWLIIRQLCKRNSHVLIDYIFQNKIDINSEDENRWRPLHYAAQYCDLGVIQELVRNGAEMIKTDLRLLPVHIACKYAQKDVVEWFINKLVQDKKSEQLRNCKDENGRGFLHYAAQNKHLDVILFMLDLQLDVNDRDREGQTALHYGANYFTSNIVEKFCQKSANINWCDDEGRTALHLAAKAGNASFVLGLLENGVEVNMRDAGGHTAFMLATSQLHFDIVTLFLDLHSEHVQLTDPLGKSPLHLACIHSNFQAVCDLVKHNIGRCFINDVDKFGKSALHYAAEKNDLQIVYVLSVSGADLEIKDSVGKTPLHVAVENSFISSTRMLLQHGSRVDEKDNNGKTPLYYSVMRNVKAITDLLVAYGASDDDGYDKAPAKYSRSVVKSVEDSDEIHYVQIWKNLCLLEMEMVPLLSKEYIFCPSKKGYDAITYIKQKMQDNPSSSYNFLVYCKDDVTEKSGTLREYAVLFLRANLPYLSVRDIDSHCYNLVAVIQTVADEHGLPACTVDAFRSQIADFRKPIILSAGPFKPSYYPAYSLGTKSASPTDLNIEPPTKYMKLPTEKATITATLKLPDLVRFVYEDLKPFKRGNNDIFFISK